MCVCVCVCERERKKERVDKEQIKKIQSAVSTDKGYNLTYQLLY